MTINAFIPQIWVAELLTSLKKTLVYGQPSVANRRYEGQIKNQGDTVRITSVNRPTIATYTKGVTTINPEQLTDAQRALLIDQAKYFAFEIDDIDMAQAVDGGALMSEAAVEAAYGMADGADQFIAGLYTGVQSANQVGTVAVPAATPTAFYDSILVPLGVKLDEANVPAEGRYCVIPPWLRGRAQRDDRFVRVDASGSDTTLRNGIIGRAAGFDILMSNNAPLVTGDDYLVLAGYPGAISYAEQIVKTEPYRPEDSFSDALKGLHVYGAKLLRPDGAATALASQT